MGGVLAGLEPEIVWGIFEEISRIPRCSGKEQRIQEWIRGWAGENDISFNRDEAGNILLTREAAPDCGEYPTLTLQGHQDMVCEKTLESPHDFERDSIPVVVEGGAVKADGTTLGADNGIGMAIAMALLIDPALEGHGRIEALLTVEEETGLTGAINMQPGFFTGRRMINLDSEELGVIIIGSAGGGGTRYTIPVGFSDAEVWEGVRLEVSGLLGGHSGVDIHLPRRSANKLVGEGLKRVKDEMPLRIMHIEGGTRGNAIARSARCDFLVPEGGTARAIEILGEWGSQIDQSVEKDLKITCSKVQADMAFSEEESASVIGVISGVSQGPFSWSEDIEGLVQTSNNLGLVRTEEGMVSILVSSRSSDADDLKKDRAILRALGEKYGAEVEQRPGYPGWKADPRSPFLGLVARSYERVLGREPKVTAIHAGLECGFLSRFDPELKIVSLGPDLRHPHSHLEEVDVESVKVLWEVVKTVARELVSE